MNFSEKLNKQRKLNNISQEQLADALGISRQSVSKWETGESYPDMAKISQICKILNCSFSDIVDDEIVGDSVSAVNKETDKKNYLDDFLSYVTKTYNMFIHMTLRSKIVMSFEMFMISVFLLSVGTVITLGIYGLLNMALRFIGYQIRSAIINVVISLIAAMLIVVGVITLFHLFKIRYLDYYVTIEDDNVDIQSVEEPIDENKDTSELIKKKNNVIVIRDPKHSSSRFFNGLAKIVIFFLKCLLVCIALPFVFGIVIAVGGIVSCLSSKGMVFRSFAVVLMGVGIICYLAIHFTYNVIFNLKQPIKQFLIIFVVGLIIGGVGCGLTFNAITSLKTIDETLNLKTKTDTVKFDSFKAGDDLNIFWYPLDIKIVVDETRQGVEIEAQHYDCTEVYVYVSNGSTDNNQFNLSTYTNDYSVMKILKEDLSNDSLRSNYDFHNFTQVTVYCNSELAEYLSGSLQ